MPTVNEALRDRGIAHAIFLQRQSTATVHKVVALLNRLDDRLVEQLRERLEKVEQRGADLAPITTRRLRELLDAVRKLVDAGYERLAERTAKELVDIVTHEAAFEAETLRKAIPLRVEVVVPAEQVLVSAVNARPFQGRLLNEWFADAGAAKLRRLRDAIRLGVAEGATVDQLVRTIRGTRAANFRDGILEASRRDVESVVRTSINHISNHARQATYIANGDIVKSWLFVATIDGKTTITCASLDHKTFPIGKGPMPPRHVNCRSTSIPITKSYRELGLDLDEVPATSRASMDGQIPSGVDFDTWLRGRSAEFQDEVLGRSRGKLFRAGMKMERFTDRGGEVYDLPTLRAREAAAFERAGL
jgi:SPP1 gp7 family putative phage head morphogenesis protein